MFLQALVNDLDLTAKQGLITYYANGQLSTAGYNALNNVEQITIANPVVGSTVTVTVTAYSLATSQPYSLVVTGNFKKDYRNFNKAIPQVNVIATDGAQVSQRHDGIQSLRKCEWCLTSCPLSVS